MISDISGFRVTVSDLDNSGKNFYLQIIKNNVYGLTLKIQIKFTKKEFHEFIKELIRVKNYKLEIKYPANLSGRNSKWVKR